MSNTPAPVPKTSQIEDQLKNYECHIARLATLIENVEKSLVKILHDDTSEESESKCGNGDLVSLASDVEELNRRFSRNLDKLCNMANRIEL